MQMVRHVLRPGDVYFASGDLLRRDAFGFYFWVDRMGDTFRLVRRRRFQMELVLRASVLY